MASSMAEIERRDAELARNVLRPEQLSERARQQLERIEGAGVLVQRAAIAELVERIVWRGAVETMAIQTHTGR
jgi:hypothetical protein